MPFAAPGQNNEGRPDDNPGLSDKFHQLPIITRYWFGLALVETMAVNFAIFDGFHIFWDWGLVRSKLQLYRLVLPFCYAGGKSLDTLITLYMIVQFSKQYEKGGPFNTGAGGGTADYVFCLLLGIGGTLLTFPLLEGFLPPIFCDNILFYVLYIWSKKNPTSQSNIWGFPVSGKWLPFAYLLLKVLLDKPYFGMLHGMALGHVYYFAVDVVPMVYGKDFLQTPMFLIQYFGVGEYREVRDLRAPARAPRAGGHDWGAGGNRLGTN